MAFLLPGKVGGLERGRANAGPEVGDLLIGVSGYSKPNHSDERCPPSVQSGQPVGAGAKKKEKSGTVEEGRRFVDS